MSLRLMLMCLVLSQWSLYYASVAYQHHRVGDRVGSRLILGLSWQQTAVSSSVSVFQWRKKRALCESQMATVTYA